MKKLLIQSKLAKRILSKLAKKPDIETLGVLNKAIKNKLLLAVYTLFKDEGKVDFDYSHYTLSNLDGFPKNIDIDRRESHFLGIYGDKAWFCLDGDWRPKVYLTLELKGDKLKVSRADAKEAPKYSDSRVQSDIYEIEAAGLEIDDTFFALRKAMGHKYIRRWPDPKNPKKYRYLYASDFLRPVKALFSLFSVKKEKIDSDYEKNNIKNEYGADKKTFAAHILEYFSNKIKWDNFFSRKDKQEKYKKPQKSGGALGRMNAPSGGNKKGKTLDTGKEKGDNKGVSVNKSLMRKIWTMYSGQEAESERTGQEQTGTGRGSISQAARTVQSGEDQGNGSQHGTETVQHTTDNGGNDVQLPSESGKRSGRTVRLTKSQTKNIREECLALLKSKTNEQMTEDDKALLRQYEGAGGLGEDGASTHGTLYEYYTPRNVVNKVWQLVDKYIPGAKSVLEPSAGIGRFAEDRTNDRFTLNEYDPTSARISEILHPEAKNTKGAFQAMFKPGKPYAGNKYDVVIGNPPYGSYEGLWKGKGEGTDHTRYEEYFIDRGLDTLREGGIMAFVVPSAFLRGGNDKIKEKIAAKGKLLEAWRLPNGTFNTTGVGTDIIIVRKEKGDPAQFSDNAYFEENPTMVIGTETTRIGRFGKEEKVVSLEGGISWDNAIDSINAGYVEAAPVGVPTEKEKYVEKSEVTKKKKSESEKKQNRSDAMKGNDNAAGKRVFDVDTAAEFNAKYNKHIAPEALSIWKNTNWDGSINVTNLQNTHYLEHSGNYVKDLNGNWYDIVNFASGNIYSKLRNLEMCKDEIPAKEYERQKSILEKALPKPQSILEFEISPLSDIAEKFMTSEASDGSEWRRAFATRRRLRNGAPAGGFTRGDDDEEGQPLSLNRAFLQWLRNTSTDKLAIRVSKSDIEDFIYKKSVRAVSGKNDAEKEANRLERDRTRTQRREDTERLFTQFIREQLSVEDQKRLEDTYNQQYTANVQADYSKIPVFLDGISRTFKDSPFIANESQMKGVTWLANQGNGIVAFDVGVGKTITGIMAAVNDMQMGRCEKPLKIVPKAVIKNWAFEIQQLFPGIKVNILDNFSDIGRWKDKDGKLNIEKGSITLCTYEALEKIGFSDETLETDLKEAFVEALSVTDEKDNKRKKESEKESIMTKVGKASRTGDNWINWEDTGFDHITVDEAHNFRNSFAKPRTKTKGDAAEFDDIPSGSESLRGLKLFAIAQMVQKHNNGRNVHLLTATPFQNSPVEIYNMLSLVAREQLKAMGIMNFNEFLVQFAELKPELAVNSKNSMIQKNVMKGFKNLPALQRLLNQYIMKIDGEDAGIIRPDKQAHQTFLDPTPEQRDILEKIRAYMEAGPDPKEDPGATLRCITAQRMATLSPMLADGFEFLDPIAMAKAGIKDRQIKVKNKDFVKHSPKMKFNADMIAGFYKQHKDIGQIMHLPQGIENYEAVRDYLISQGVPPDAIVFMAPAPDNAKNKKLFLPGGDRGNDVKEERKDAFNDPNNKVKIIIGSDTIIEGVNLNGNTAPTYEGFLPWNPTARQQLGGRSHRQGNKQGKVHIVTPLVNDSVDSFMYQKHDEKQSRHDALWTTKANKMEIDEIKPEELKFALIKDPKKRADLVIREKTAELEQQQKITEATSDRIFSMGGERKTFASEIEDNKKEIEKMRKVIDEFNKKTDAEIIKEHDLDFSNNWSSQIYDSYGNAKGKDIKEVRKNYVEAVKKNIAESQNAIARCKGKTETIDNTLKRYGIDDPNNTAAIERVRKQYANEALRCKDEIETIEKDRPRYIREAEKQIKKESRPGEAVNVAVDRILKNITDNLYSMDAVREREKAKQTKQPVAIQKALDGKKMIFKKVKRNKTGARA
ncbi:MAG: N-6 DNA methylase [Treponema sp.]|nr:N-6 DNA methylase [Treponema sp.]